jgi:hypothetical protein
VPTGTPLISSRQARFSARSAEGGRDPEQTIPPPRTGSRTFAELLIDREEDRTLRAVLVGMLRKWDRPLGIVEKSGTGGPRTPTSSRGCAL